MDARQSTASAQAGRKGFSLRGQIILALVAIATLGYGGIYMRNLWRERQMGEASLNWPQTEGMLTQCEYRGSRRSGAHARISYQYVIAGKTYFSKQVNVAKDYLLLKPQAFVDEHPVGTKISVYYNHDHPEVAVIVPGIDNENTTLLVLFSAMFLVLGVSTIAIIFQLTRRAFAAQAVRAQN